VKALAALLIGIVLIAGTPALAGQKDVEERLTCQCGCGLTVHTCNHLQCSFAIPVRTDITKSLAAGEAADDIIDRYMNKYGEKILSSPTHIGFNLVAWYGPYLALLLAGTIIIITMRRWTSRSRAPTAEDTVVKKSDHSAPDHDRLARELEDLDT